MSINTLTRHTRKIFLVMISIGLIYKVNANPTMDAKFYNPTFTGTGSSTKYTVTLAVKSNDPSENLGGSVFIFTYNSTDISFPSSPSSGTDYSFINFSGSAYSTGTVTRPASGIIFVNVSLPTGHTGTDISSGYVDVCDITFSVLNLGTGTNSNLSWAMNESSPPTMDDVFDDGSASSFTVYNSFDENSFTGINTTPLPVSLLHFDVNLKNNAAEIQWATSSELNNNYFTIERSSNGNVFEPILTIKGGGNSQDILEYSAIDEDPLPGISYYRLRQTDYNGKTETFNMVSVSNKNLPDFAIESACLDPENASAYIKFIVPGGGKANISILNMKGKPLILKSQNVMKGSNRFELSNTGNWPRGIYVINLEYNGKLISSKLQKY